MSFLAIAREIPQELATWDEGASAPRQSRPTRSQLTDGPRRVRDSILTGRNSMLDRYRLYQRENGVFYLQDKITGKQQSTRIKDEVVAKRLLAGHFVTIPDVHRLFVGVWHANIVGLASATSNPNRVAQPQSSKKSFGLNPPVKPVSH